MSVSVSSATLAPGLTLLFETASFIPDAHEVSENEATGLVIEGCEMFERMISEQ